MTLKPEHIVEELNRTPKLKRDLIMKISHNQRGGIPNEKLPKKCPFCGETMLLEDYRVDVEKRPQGIKPILGEVLFPPYIQDYSYDL